VSPLLHFSYARLGSALPHPAEPIFHRITRRQLIAEHDDYAGKPGCRAMASCSPDKRTPFSPWRADTRGTA
jgi:hypothetical protein